jgi:hypothetical protein
MPCTFLVGGHGGVDHDISTAGEACAANGWGDVVGGVSGGVGVGGCLGALIWRPCQLWRP